MSVTQDLFTLKNKSALITGATGSLGKVICHTLCELGADLYIVDLKFSRLEELGINSVKISSRGCSNCMQFGT